MLETIITDTSALIVLEKIRLLETLRKIYAEIIIPETVINEFGNPNIECYSVKKVEGPLAKLFVSDLNLGKGESEVIVLANEMGIKAIIDDLKDRKVAETLGLKVTGTIGVSLKAEKLGFTESAYKKAKELRKKDSIFLMNCWMAYPGSFGSTNFEMLRRIFLTVHSKNAAYLRGAGSPL